MWQSYKCLFGDQMPVFQIVCDLPRIGERLNVFCVSGTNVPYELCLEGCVKGLIQFSRQCINNRHSR